MPGWVPGLGEVSVWGGDRAPEVGSGAGHTTLGMYQIGHLKMVTMINFVMSIFHDLKK